MVHPCFACHFVPVAFCEGFDQFMNAIADAHLGFLHLDAFVGTFLDLESFLDHICREQISDFFVVNLNELASD